MTGMVQDANALEAGLRAALNVSGVTTLATSGVFNGAAVEGTACPFVVFGVSDGARHAYNFGDNRTLTDSLYLVKGVTEGLATLNAGLIDAAINVALTTALLTVTGYTVTLCRRVQDVSYIEVDQGREYRHRGGMYAIQLTS